MSTKKKTITKICFSSTFLLFIFFVSQGFPTSDSTVNNNLNDHAQSMIIEFKNSITSNQLELLDLKENLEWLNLKVNSITSSNRTVPLMLSNSVQYKSKRIQALERKNAYCMERLLYFQKQAHIPEKIQKPETQTTLKINIQSRIREFGLSDWLEIVPNQDSGSFTLKTTLPILFSSGSAVLVSDYKKFLKTLAGLIREFDSQIIVDGFADIDPIHTKKYPSNFELGATRAANVVHALIKNGVKPSAFKITSTGRYRILPLKMSKNKTLERYVNIAVKISG